ncbi:hypothetical protein [Halosimplex marinum]|uniref:hypothetical protein n=1 Tax=Halosimplex marinum TaxID=3396620 RepID=UPI003F55E565
MIHWVWPADEEFDTDSTPFEDGRWYHHETTVASKPVEETFGTSVFHSKKAGIPRELVKDRIDQTATMDAETVRERWRQTNRYDIRSELDLEPPRSPIAADGGDVSWPPEPIQYLINEGYIERHEWPMAFSPELLGALRDVSLDTIRYVIEQRDCADNHGLKIWKMPECLAVEQLLRLVRPDLAIGSGHDDYSGPLFTYSKERNWKLETTGYRPSSPINLVWKSSSTTKTARQVANHFISDGWIRVFQLLSQNRVVINVRDSAGDSDHSATTEPTKGVDIWIPTKQHHVRLFETKGTDFEHRVVGQAHCDPFDHGVIVGDGPHWMFNDVRDIVLDQWTQKEFNRSFVDAGNGCFEGCDGKQGRIIGMNAT